MEGIYCYTSPPEDKKRNAYNQARAINKLPQIVLS